MARNVVIRTTMGLICVCLLSGCANIFLSSEQLRAEPHQKGTVSFRESYPVILENITASAKECFSDRPLYYRPPGLPPSPHLTVTSVELEPGKRAKVEALEEGLGLDGGSEDVFMSLDIRATTSGTDVDYYIGRKFFGTYDSSSSFVPIANSWSHGDGTKCS